MKINFNEVNYNGYGISGNAELKRALINAHTKQNGDPKFKVEKSAITSSNGKCFYCGCDLFKETNDDSLYKYEVITDKQGVQLLAFDHLFPSANGNPLVCGNAVAACSSCNGEKSDESPFSYDKRRRELGKPTLFKTRDEFISKVNEISKRYKENYPIEYNFGQRAEQESLTASEIDEYYQWMFSKISINRGIKENWNLTEIELHPSYETFRSWTENVSESSRAFINKVISALSQNPDTFESMPNEFIISTIKEKFEQHITNSSKSMASIARCGLRYLLTFITNKEIFNELKGLVYDEWETHVSSAIFGNWIDSIKLNSRPIVRKIVNSLASDSTSIETRQADKIANTIKKIYKEHIEGIESSTAFFNARSGVKELIFLINNDKIYELTKELFLERWEIHPDTKLFRKMKAKTSLLNSDMASTINKLVTALSEDLTPISERSAIKLFNTISNVLDKCVATSPAKELIMDINRDDLLQLTLMNLSYKWVAELIKYDTKFWLSLTSNHIIARQDIVKAFTYFNKNLKSFDDNELNEKIREYYNPELNSKEKQKRILIIKKICEYYGLNKDLTVANLDPNIPSIYFDFKNVLNHEDLDLIKNEYPKMGQSTISAINKLAIYLIHNTDDRRISSISENEWILLFGNTAIEPLKRIRYKLFNNEQQLMSTTKFTVNLHTKDINSSFWTQFLNKESEIYSKSKGSSKEKNLCAAKAIRKQFNIQFKEKNIYSLSSSDITSFFDNIVESLDYERSMKTAIKRVMKLMALELNLHWAPKNKITITKESQAKTLLFR